jgi:demethylmenaquinone methyltransferase / 2-methoxy-6-polyprenyl-1,4-benzoquinol methylase
MTLAAHSERVVPDRRFVRSLFSALAPRYEEAVLAYSLGQDLRWKRTMIDRLPLHRGDRALDLACGTGLVIDRLGRQLGRSSVTGLDPNRMMLTQTPRTTTAGRLVQANAERIPFRDATFDVVTAGYLFKYVDLDRLFQEVRRVLAPGGRVGGYDFSSPRRGTPVGRLYGVYLHRMLPWLGRRRGGLDVNWRQLLEFLADVAERSGWEDRIDLALRSNGFVNIRKVASLGGAITWIWARVEGRSPALEGPVRTGPAVRLD